MTSDLPCSSSSSIIYRATLGRLWSVRMVMTEFRRWRLCLLHNIWRRRFQCNWNARTKCFTCSATKFRTDPIQVKAPALIVLNLIVVVVHINLISTVSLHTRLLIRDLYLTSETVGNQHELRWEKLPTPSLVQLAVLGPRSKVKYWVTTEFWYQTIKGDRKFDVINLSSYDLILGTLFLYQHRVST